MKQYKQPLLQIIVFLLTIFVSSTYATENKNSLYQHASPYLAMHGQDPVNWLDWQATTLKKSKKTDKIIMISSGYFSCHWCHVMQKQNYHDQETASFLNQHFISVKIDRELTPDLDRYLIDFAQRAAGHAGWPQHVFLTPDGYPFFAFTYKPKPDFLASLKKIQSVWKNSRSRVIATAKSAILPIDNQTRRPLKNEVFIQDFIKQLIPQMDTLSGGLKGSNKFPNASILKAALLLKKDNEAISDWLITTLDQMQSQHLFDHIYGGFYRYTVDPEWQTPHFEKMLYTQAQLAEIYLIAGQKFNRQDYKQTAKQTLDYVLKQLYHPISGLYQSSQSAVDKNQIEAADYVWTKKQLKQTLTNKQFQIIKKAWLSQPTEYEIPTTNTTNRLEPAWHPSPTYQQWQVIKQALANNKIKPAQNIPTDSKSIIGWNGLLLSTFSKAVALNQLDEKIAENLAQNLIKNLDKNIPPRALSASNQSMGEANIQDYAYVIQGLENWAKVSKKNHYNQKAQNYRQQAKLKFATATRWRYANSPILPGQVGSQAIDDSAIPSPTAILDCSLSKQFQMNPLSFASYGTCN